MKLPCPPDQWPRFSARLDELMALPETDRAAWLAALSDADADLRPGLAAVLACLPESGGGFLSGPAPVLPAPGHQAGQQLGPYELLRELGRGGMGVVWLARRADGAYAREVALKLPHAHLLAGAVRERFDRERDILAALDHPHIARFFDAGLAADGQPYLALEAIDGRPITDWCREQALPLAARLALFAQVAGAVSHAHGQFIAHRDLKPANVLVTTDGQVKLLDFGIAKLLADEGAPDSTALTRDHGLLATPRYAAPEQPQRRPRQRRHGCLRPRAHALRAAHRQTAARWRRAPTATLARGRRSRPAQGPAGRSGRHRRPRCSAPPARPLCLRRPRWRRICNATASTAPSRRVTSAAGRWPRAMSGATACPWA